MADDRKKIKSKRINRKRKKNAYLPIKTFKHDDSQAPPIARITITVSSDNLGGH